MILQGGHIWRLDSCVKITKNIYETCFERGKKRLGDNKKTKNQY